MANPFALDPQAWSTLRTLLDDALALDPAERRGWLDALVLRPEHAALKPRLEALLAHADTLDERRFVTLPKVETRDYLAAPRRTAGGAASHDAPGDRVGPYRLVRPLGEGGMGSVWLAERTDMLQRRPIALKLPRDAVGRALADRLQREREILAGLDHPHIARLYDAGADARGRPYLALEYVEGQPIDVYCAARALDVPARLRLFLQVLRAVAFAHARLVVHRDLKPSNVLVTADGEVRLLDFGIARLLEPAAPAAAPLTEMGALALTPQYAAPEQITGGAVTTVADVYALGVLLYQLLTGVLPYRLPDGAASRRALEDLILASEPPRPSTAAADPARQRALRGDLDTIVLRALKKSPDERYRSADAFAEDIERLLTQRPVLARPDTPGYRLRKWVARNRVAAAASVAVSVAVLGGAGAATWQARKATAQAQRAEEVTAFVVSIFEDANPWSGAQARPSAADLLQRATQRVQQRFGDDPLVRLELLNALGASLTGVLQLDDAEKILREAEALGQRVVGPDDPRAIRTAMLLLDVYLSAGKTAQLKAGADALIPRLERDPQRHGTELAVALLRHAQVANDEGDYKKMESLGRRSLDVVERYRPAAQRERLRAYGVIANALENQGDGPRAIEASTRALQAAEALWSVQPDHPELAERRFIHGRILDRFGDWRAALPYLERAIADTEKVFGADSIRAATMRRSFTAVLVNAHRLVDALANVERVLPTLEREHGADSLPAAYARVARASVLAALHRPQSAFDDYDKAARVLHDKLGPDKQYLLHVRALRARALAQTGRKREAVAETTDVLRRHLQAGEPAVWQSVLSHAIALRLDDRAADALAILEQHQAFARTPAHRQRHELERAFALLALGRVPEALPLLQDAQRRVASDGLPMTPERAEVALALGRALLAQNARGDALPHLQRAAMFWREFEPLHPQAAEAARWVARAG